MSFLSFVLHHNYTYLHKHIHIMATKFYSGHYMLTTLYVTHFLPFGGELRKLIIVIWDLITFIGISHHTNNKSENVISNPNFYGT